MALEVEYKRTSVLVSQLLQSQAMEERAHLQHSATKRDLAETRTQRDALEASLATANSELQSTQDELRDERTKHQSTLSALAACKQEVEQLKSLTNVCQNVTVVSLVMLIIRHSGPHGGADQAGLQAARASSDQRCADAADC